MALRGAKIVAAAVACVASSSVASCGGDVAGPADLHGDVHAHAASEAVMTACRASAKALCARAADCSPKYIPFFFETVTDCEATVTDACVARYEGPGASSAPNDCVAEAGDAPCEIIADPVSSIAFDTPEHHLLSVCPVTPGTLPDHSACLRDGDCASGRCADPLPGARQDVGCMACTPQHRLFEACDEVGVSRILCEQPLRCIAGRCLEPAPAGASCGAPDDCAGGVCVDGLCLARLGADEPCSEAGPNACDLGRGLVCADDQTCRSVSIVGPGDPCEPLREIPKATAQLCDARGSCGDQGTCTPLPRRGEPCTKACRIGLTCQDGRCVTELWTNGSAACVAP